MDLQRKEKISDRTEICSTILDDSAHKFYGKTSLFFTTQVAFFSIFELDSLFEPTQRLSSLENRANLIVQDSVDLWQLFHDKRKWVFIISVLHFSRFCKLSLATNNQHLATRDHVSIVQNSVFKFQIFWRGMPFWFVFASFGEVSGTFWIYFRCF